MSIAYIQLFVHLVPELEVTLPGNDQTALSVVEGENLTINVSVPAPNLIDVQISVTVSPDTAEKGIRIEER